MSLELTGVHGLLKRHKLFTHKYSIYSIQMQLTCAATNNIICLTTFVPQQYRQNHHGNIHCIRI